MFQQSRISTTLLRLFMSRNDGLFYHYMLDITVEVARGTGTASHSLDFFLPGEYEYSLGFAQFGYPLVFVKSSAQATSLSSPPLLGSAFHVRLGSYEARLGLQILVGSRAISIFAVRLSLKAHDGILFCFTLRVGHQLILFCLTCRPQLDCSPKPTQMTDSIPKFGVFLLY